ncbi:DENN domain-containing protein 1A isoform X1 [Wyeomyia smithii]|uniref:DENN domain-containing protein 1A isoform X1 n=1 Tax=Wyeomyia smithii TaxID=174621 RepID=UPI0024680F93|nr:DENN domain-containing protein 1A isoform X1 [Wyeomyia smithii]XP_055539755.1 DENN domain-containing protein 1A isoform X1 [Wyeomyia smithii]
MNSRIKEDVSRLFEYWCEISPGTATSPSAASPSNTSPAPATATDKSPPGCIVQSFPESFKDTKVIADIPAFAFPCAFERRTIQVHSFVLTNIDSKWRFGFCRHDPKSPTAMVIVTYLPWHDTFIRFLNVLADVRKHSQSEFEAFLAEAYNKGVPEPGGCLKLQYDRPVQTFSFQRPQQFLLPSIPENHNLNLYYNFVEPKFMIGIFAAMLAERRIIFVSRRLDILSSCIQAANAFLYPMVWQHIFIPVLPMKMKDILGAPMPFLIGVPEAVFESLRREEIGDVVILNCDKRTLETPFDDVKNMPPELVASLKKHLANSAEHRGDRVSKIFLGILVQLIGGYRDAVKFNDKITFDPDTFIDTRPSHLRPFLANMLQLQIFQQFIEERLDMLNTGQGFSDEFEVECFRYAEKSGRKVKQYKDLLKNFKDKTNPAVRSAVKSVKEGGKGVKTAYKGLRSKFRETTPPKSKLDSSLHSHVSQYDIGHQSAPNSPVFNKRPQTIALPDDSYHGHAQMLTPSSTSLYNSPHIMMSNSSHNNYNTITGCSTGTMNNNFSSSSSNNNHHGHHYNTSSSSDVRSPSLSLSPTSSNSSSEMNLLQELQHLALFKSPAVNRNLKPAYSMDGTIRSSSRTGAPLSPPGSGQMLPRIQEAPSSSSAAAQPLLQLDLGTVRTENGRVGNNYNNNDDDDDPNFDLSPDMPCPPVPPRRFQTAAEALAAIQISPPPMSPPSSSSSTSASPYRNYNFLQQAAIMQPKPNHSAQLNPNSTGSAPSVISQSPPLPSPPPPPPLKASRNDPLVTQFDDDELITLMPNSSTNASSQIVLEPTGRQPSRSNSISNSSSHNTQPATPHAPFHHNNHQKPPAPQPPQRPPLAPKPTFRKESNNDVADALVTTATSSISPVPRTGAIPIKPPSPFGNEPPDTSTDLINLDTTNSSFELEDFDPLNDNAKPIPTASAAVLNSCGLTAPAATLSRSPPAPTGGLGFDNPIYPYFTPTHLHGTTKSATSSPLSSSFNAVTNNTLAQNYHHAHHQHSLSQGNFSAARTGPVGSGSTKLIPNSAQDDFELLRNYGLDRFGSLLDSASNGKEKPQRKQQHHMASLLSNSAVHHQQQGNINTNGSSHHCSNSNTSGNNGFNKLGTVNNFVNGRASNASTASTGGTKTFNNWTTFD